MALPAPDASPASLGELLQALAGFSAPGAGVTRLAYAAHWRAAHRWLAERARAMGLLATPDAAGNLLFHPAQAAPGRGQTALLVGSHLDSVKHGGRYDGALGAVAGLLLAAECAGRTRTPVVGFVTGEEEGSRFGGTLMGARSLLGLVEAAELDRERDESGTTWRQALEEVRAHGGCAPLAAGDRPFAPLFVPALALELHIEQGPVLEAEGLPLGIVERIAGYRRWKASVEGEARHTGTTPPPMKRDALAASAEMVAALEAVGAESGEAARATAGNLRLRPGLFNVVPEHCELWMEMRHVDAARLSAMAAELARRCREIAARRKVVVALQEVSAEDPVPLDPALVQKARALAEELGLRHRVMTSGAAHDAMIFARAGVPSLMVFVPSRRGISHSPEEFTAAEQLWTGYLFMRELCLRLAR